MSKVYAHRGGAGYFVENTLKAFEFAIELGCDGAELDVQLTRDGQVVVYHDGKLNHRNVRQPDGAWIASREAVHISEITLEELQKYTIGEPNPKFHNRKAWPNLLPEFGQKIPTLSEVIELVKSKSDKFELLIEFKTDIFNEDPGSWVPLVDAVLRAVEASKFNCRAKFCSFNWNTLLYARKQSSSIPLWFTTHPFSWLNNGSVPYTDLSPSAKFLTKLRTAWATGNATWYGGFAPKTVQDFPEVIKEAGGDAWFCYHTDATRENIKFAKNLGVKISAWSVNCKVIDPASALLDTVCLDYPKSYDRPLSAEMQILLSVAYDLRKNKELDKAKRIYDDINKSCDVKPARFYKDYAVLLRFYKDFKACGELLEEGLALYPHETSLLIEKAVLYRDKKDLVGSCIIYQKSLKILGESVSKLDANRYKIIFDTLLERGFGIDIELKKEILYNHVSILAGRGSYRNAYDCFRKYKGFFFDNLKGGFLYRQLAALANQEYLLAGESGNITHKVNVALIPSGNKLWDILPLKLAENDNCNIVFSLGYPSNNTLLSKKMPSCEFYDVDAFCMGVSLTFQDLPFSPGQDVIHSSDFLHVKNKALKMMDRQDVLGRFRLVDREAIFYSMFFYFYSMLKEKNVELLFAAHSPHLPSSYTLFEAARILGINTVCCMQNTLLPGFELRTDFKGTRVLSVSSNKIKDEAYAILKNYVLECSAGLASKVEPDYMRLQKQKDVEAGLDLDREAIHLEYNPQVNDSLDPNSPSSVKRTWQVRNIDFLYAKNPNSIKYSFKKEVEFASDVRDFLLNEYKFCVGASEIGKKYVFFPLHYEPEKTSNPDGGDWYNTYDAIAALRKFLPSEVKIVIKEHYSQFTSSLNGYKARSPYFYRALSTLPNVVFVDFKEPSALLIDGSIFVASQTGTACLEAACSGKKSVLFGYPWFYNCPNTFSFDELSNYEEVLDSEVFSTSEVLDFMRDWIDRFYIYGAFSGSDISTARKRYSDKSYLYDNLELTAKEIIDTLLENDFLGRRRYV